MTSIEHVADENSVSDSVNAGPQPGASELSAEAPEQVNGGGAAQGSHDADGPEADGEAGDTDEGQAASGNGDPGAPGTGKRKRRRRKKKPGAAGAEAPAAAAPARAPNRGNQKPQRVMERPAFGVGEEVFGKVTAVLDTAIMVDLAGKALAIFDRSEMEPDDLVPAVGDRLVARVHQDGARGGLVVLTRKPLREEEIKPVIEKAYKEGTLVHGLVTGVIKGGVEVDIKGLRAFAPASGLDLHPSHANFAGLVGQVLDFKVIQFEHHGRDVVVTRRPMLEAEAHERRKEALGTLTEGQVLRGVVRTVVEWGAFVALPGAENLEGLVHVSEASHDPRAALADILKPGDSFDVKILRVDERGKLWLSRKALMADPWAEARAKYAVRTKHTAKVTRVEPFGVSCSLDSDIEGFIHISDLSLTRVEDPATIAKVGDELEVVVVNFDFENRRVGLHPAPKPEHADEAPQKVSKNGALKVEVVKGEPGGLTVRVLGATGRFARGFIPAGQTGTARGTDLRKTFKVGQVLDTKVVDLDRRGEVKLSIQGLKEDEERKAARDYRQKLKAESGFGTLGDLLKKRLGQS
ncbi:MAG: S1 RNA-binding domain-containing protein [Polyangiaceae bacterium]|nr:S1 RNA-binding domain-containing protein [Polyangiaceae bacterium]